MIWHQLIARAEDGQVVQLQLDSLMLLQVQCSQVNLNNQLMRPNRTLRNCTRLCFRSKRRFSMIDMQDSLQAAFPNNGDRDSKQLQTVQDQHPPRWPHSTTHLSKTTSKLTTWKHQLQHLSAEVSSKTINNLNNCMKLCKETNRLYHQLPLMKTQRNSRILRLIFNLVKIHLILIKKRNRGKVVNREVKAKSLDRSSNLLLKVDQLRSPMVKVSLILILLMDRMRHGMLCRR